MMRLIIYKTSFKRRTSLEPLNFPLTEFKMMKKFWLYQRKTELLPRS